MDKSRGTETFDTISIKDNYGFNAGAKDSLILAVHL